MQKEELIKLWKEEEQIAHIKGWDFSHIEGGRSSEEEPPWSYEELIRQYLTDEMRLLDYDTGGGEFLLSLQHPFEKTCATEGYPPNVELCRKTLIPLGIDLRECSDCSKIPFEDESFDIVINRHGGFDPKEIRRILKSGGLFNTQQVGEKNDHDLVEMVLPDEKSPFPGMSLEIQKKAFEDEGFEIINSGEHFGALRFFDIGAFVWFARIIEWEFPGFSVDECLDRLWQMQQKLEKDGFIEGTTHRYMLVARKK